MSLGNVTWTLLAPQSQNLLGKTTRSDEWAAKSRFRGKRRSFLVEVPEDIGVLSFSEVVKGIGWEAGSLCRRLTKPQEIRAFSLNVSGTSNLPSSNCFLRFRPFAPVFRSFFCNDTRNVTRRECLASFSRRKFTLMTSSLRSATRCGVVITVFGVARSAQTSSTAAPTS